MDFIYTTILELFNSLIPTSAISTWGNINEILAYIGTIGVLWLFLLKPFITLVFGNGKKR